MLKIELDIKDAKYKVWNKKKQEWFYLIEEKSPLGSGFLTNESKKDLYLLSSLSAAPEIWGEPIPLEETLHIELKKKELEILLGYLYDTIEDMWPTEDIKPILEKLESTLNG